MGRYNFGQIVIVDDDQIGVIVKCWGDDNYEVYVRNYNNIKAYKTKHIEHYIYSKSLLDEQRDFY